MAKLGDQRFGPFKIMEKIRNTSYCLDIPKKWKNIYPVFNEVLLSPYHKLKFPSQPRNTEPPQLVVSKELEYEVDRIIDSKKIRGTVKYKVSWKGYGPHKNTWEPLSNLTNAKKLVDDFHKNNPTKPKPNTIQKLEIPMSIFPKELLRPMPPPLTTPAPSTVPTAALAHRLAFRRNSCPKEGVMS